MAPARKGRKKAGAPARKAAPARKPAPARKVGSARTTRNVRKIGSAAARKVLADIRKLLDVVTHDSKRGWWKKHLRTIKLAVKLAEDKKAHGLTFTRLAKELTRRQRATLNRWRKAVKSPHMMRMVATNDLTMRIVEAWEPAWDDLSFAEAMRALKSKNKKLLKPKPKPSADYVALGPSLGEDPVAWVDGVPVLPNEHFSIQRLAGMLKLSNKEEIIRNTAALLKSELPFETNLDARQIYTLCASKNDPRDDLLTALYYKEMIGALQYGPYDFGGVETILVSFMAVTKQAKRLGINGALLNKCLTSNAVRDAPFVAAEIHPYNHDSYQSFKQGGLGVGRTVQRVGAILTHGPRRNTFIPRGQATRKTDYMIYVLALPGQDLFKAARVAAGEESGSEEEESESDEPSEESSEDEEEESESEKSSKEESDSDSSSDSDSDSSSSEEEEAAAANNSATRRSARQATAAVKKKRKAAGPKRKRNGGAKRYSLP